jgi:cobyrinic acid a,c-diamide synthase
MAPLAARAGHGCDILVVEGVMGLFDGSADGETASTAEVAKLLEAPVVLVVDTASMSGSVAALVHGFATFDPGVRVAGVVLNQVGSDGHETMLREALGPVGVPVLGALPRDPAASWPDRHLGLVPVAEHGGDARRALDRLVAAIEAGVDLEGVTAVASAAPARTPAPPPTAAPPVPGSPVRVAIAAGPAFSFTYEDNVELLREAGADLVPFDPTQARALPDGIRGLYAGGGFPEVFAAALSANGPLLADVARRVGAGLVTWAECGGLLWLARSLDGHPMAGVLPAEGRMTGRLTLGYRQATMRATTPIGGPGTVLRGHEFHYSAIDPPGDALELSSRFGSGRAGWASPTLLASYLHTHLAANPGLARKFVTTAAARPAD